MLAELFHSWTACNSWPVFFKAFSFESITFVVCLILCDSLALIELGYTMGPWAGPPGGHGTGEVGHAQTPGLSEI